MFSSNLTKFFTIFVPVFLFFTGCGLWRQNQAPTPAEKPSVAEVMQTGIPFKTAEPERFQAEIVIKTGDAERRTFIARDGFKRRTDFAFGQNDQFASIESDKNYLLIASQKIYMEVATPTSGGADDWASFLTTEWLSEKSSASFEKLETMENITKYRVRSGSDESSEVFIYVNETLGLPVKQEYFAVSGESKTLTYSFELRNLKSETEASLFAVPPDFRKVAAAEFYKILHSLEN